MILRIGRSDFLGLWVALLLVGILTVTKAQDASDSLLDTTLFDVGSESIQETKDQDTSSQEKKALPTSKSKKMSINPWMMTWRSVLADALKSDDKDVSKATTVTRSQSTTSNTEPTISVAFAEKLIGERSADPQSFNDVIRVDTTAFPQLVSPTKFDELLQSPKVNFKGQVGSLQKVKKVQSEGPLDEARERIKAEKKQTRVPMRVNKFKEQKPFTRTQLNSETTEETQFEFQDETTFNPGPTLMDLAREEIKASLAPNQPSSRITQTTTPSTTSSPSVNEPTTTFIPGPTPMDLARAEIRTGLESEPITFRSATFTAPSIPPSPPAPTPMDLARDEIRSGLDSDPITFRPVSFAPPSFQTSTSSFSSTPPPAAPTPMDLARAEIRSGLDVDPVTFRPLIFSPPSTSSSPPAPTPMDLVRQEIRAELNEKLQEPNRFTTFRNEDTTFDANFQDETTTARTIGPMEQARDSIKNNMSTVPTTTTTTTTVPTTPRTESPMATARNQIRNQMTTTTTDAPMISSTPFFMEPEEVTDTESPLDRMLQARDRLRLLMGGTSAPTTENTAMAEAREKIRAQLQTRRDPILKASEEAQPDFGEGLLPPGLSEDPLISVTVRGHPKDLPRPAITLEPILDLPSTTSVPLVFVDENDFGTEISSTLEPFVVTTEAQTTISPTRSEVLELLETHTESQVGNFNVLNTPSQMQGTLLKLIEKNQDPSSEEALLVESEEEFNILAGPNGKQNPLLRLLQPGNQDVVDVDVDSDFSSPSVDVTHEELQLPPQEDTKDPLEKPLFPPRKTFSDFVPPSRKQNPLLKRLRGNTNLVNTRKTFSDFKPPSSKQDTLLKPLKEDDPENANDVPPRRKFSDFQPPSQRQNPLLKRLRAGHRGRYQGLKVPGRKQDLLLRTLKAKQNQNIEGLEAPKEKETETDDFDLDSEVISEDTLGKKSEPLISKDGGTFFKNILTPNHDQTVIGLNPPNIKQDLLLRPLQANHNSDLALDPPSRDPLSQPLAGDQSDPVSFEVPNLKQDLLLRPLTPNQASNHDLSPPSLKQDLLLRPLQSGQTSSDHDLSPPPLKQDLLLRPLQSDQNDDFALEAPSRDPLAQPLAGDQSEPLALNVPSAKQNPLLRPLTANQASNHNLSLPPLKQDLLLRPLQSGQTGSNHDLTVPSIKQSTLLKQLTPNHSSNLDLEPPSVKQDPFLRPLPSQVDQNVPNLDLPDPVKSEKLQTLPRNPLERPLNPMNTFDENILDLPEIRSNPLIRIIKFDRRAKTKPNARQGSYMRLPIFRQVVLIPKKFASDFADLPAGARMKLKEIFDEKAPSSFKYEDLARKVSNDNLEEEVFANFERTTAAPNIISSTFSTIFPKAFPSTTTEPSSSSSTLSPKFRLRMPKNKFAILSVDRPADEVTFQRVNDPITSTQQNLENAELSTPFSPTLAPTGISPSSTPSSSPIPFMPTMPVHTTISTDFAEESSTLHNTQVTPTEPPTNPPPFLIPTEADDFVTEQIVPEITTFINLETSTFSSPTSLDSTTFPGTPEEDFGSEVRKVTKILQQTGFDMDRGRNRQLIQMLKNKAETSGTSKTETDENIEMVNKLIDMVKKVQEDNAEVEQFLEDINKDKTLERVVSTQASLTFDDVDDAFLLTKIKNHEGPRTDSKEGLEAPDFEQRKLNFLLQKIRSHNGTKSVNDDGLTPPSNEKLNQEEISFLLKKIQGHSGSHPDFGNILAEEEHAFLESTTEKLINDFLVRKVKNHKGHRQDPQSGLKPPIHEERFTIPSRFTPEVSTAKAIVKSFLQKKIKANAASHAHGDFGEHLTPPEGPTTTQAVEAEFLLNKIRQHENADHHDDFGDQLEPPSGSSEKLTKLEETNFLLHKIRNHVGAQTDFKDDLKVPRLHIPTTKAPIVVTTTQVTPEELFLLQKVREHKGQRGDPTKGLQLPIRHLGQPTPMPAIKSTTERLEFLIQKINSNNEVREDFGDALQFPINELEVSKDTPYSVSSTQPPTKEDNPDSEIDFLLRKINLHDGIRQDFAEVLKVPSKGTKSEKIQRDPFSIEKIKNHSGDKEDFGNVLNVPNRDEHLIQKINQHQGSRDENTDGLSVPSVVDDDAEIEPLLLKKIRTHQGLKDDRVQGLRLPIDDSEVDFLLQKIRNNQGNKENFGDFLKVPQPDPFLIQKINQHSGNTDDNTNGLTIPQEDTLTEDEAFLLQKIKSNLGSKLDHTNGLQPPISNEEEVEFLFNKIKNHQGNRESLQELLKLSDVPQRDPFLVQKINNHQGTKSDFSESLSAPNRDSFLDQKIRQHDGEREDFGAILNVPTVATTTQGTFLSQKINSHEGSRPEFGSVLEAPEHGTLPSVPRSSTSSPLSPMSAVDNFEQKLRTSETREEIEDHIMDMIVSKPDVVVDTFTSIFQTTDQVQKLEQKAKLTKMVEMDPLSVTVAFSDLMSKQNEILKEDIFTPKVPHKYEDPPKEVEGQLLRITMPESSTKPPPLPEKILNSMIEIMQAGDLEDKNIVDQMIDEGVLEIEDLRPDPMRQKEELNNKEREHMSPHRMREMLMKEGDKRPMIYRDQKHHMIEVDIDDPSHDFEMVNPENPEQIPPISGAQINQPNEEEHPFNGVEKDIDVMKSMITLYKHGMIDKAELREMMSFLGEEDIDIPEIREEDNMSAKEQEMTTKPPTPSTNQQATQSPQMMHYDHNRPEERPQETKDKPSGSTGSSYSYINFPKIPRPEQIPDFAPKPELLQNRPQSMFKEPLVDPHPFAQPQQHPGNKPAIQPPPPPPPRPTQPFVRVNGQPDRPKSVSYSHIEMPAVHRPRVPLTGERLPQPTFKPRIPLPAQPTFPPLPLTRKPVLLENFQREPLIPSSHLRPRPSPVPLFTMNQYPEHQSRPLPEGKPRPFEDKAPIVQGFSDTFTNGELKQSFEDAFSNVDISMHDFGREEEPENYGGSYYEYEEEEGPEPEYTRPNYSGYDEHEDSPPMRETEFGSDEFEDQKSFISQLIDDPHAGSHEPREIDGFGFEGVAKLKESIDEPFGHAYDGPRGVEFAAPPDQTETRPSGPRFKLSNFPQPPFAPPPGLILSRRQPWEEFPIRSSLHFPPVPDKRSQYLPLDVKYQRAMELEPYPLVSGQSIGSSEEDLSRRSFDVASDSADEEVKEIDMEGLSGLLTGNPEVDRNIGNIWVQFNQNSY